MEQDQAIIERNFIDRIGHLAKQWGLGEPAGRVWAAILFEDSALSQRQIAEKTGYTLSLVSPSLKILEKLNLIRVIRGQKREKQYELAVSFIEAFNIIIKRFLENDVKPLIKELEKLQNINKNPKLQQLIEEHKQMETYLTWFEKMIYLKKSPLDQVKKLLK